MINRRLLLSLVPLLLRPPAWAGGASAYRVTTDPPQQPALRDTFPYVSVPEAEADRIRRAVDEGRAEPLSKILEVVRNRYPGEVVNIRLKEAAGSLLYTIRVLTREGRLVDVQVNADTATIVGDRG